MVRVRFEIDVESSAACFVAGCFEGENLGMLHAAVGVGSGSDDVAVNVCDYRADVGIGRGETQSFTREFQSAVQELFVCGLVGH